MGTGSSSAMLNGNGSSGATVNGSRARTPSPRRIGSVTVAEAKTQLGPEFAILRERPVLSRAVVDGSVAMVALKDCTKETDKGLGGAVSLSR